MLRLGMEAAFDPLISFGQDIRRAFMAFALNTASTMSKSYWKRHLPRVFPDCQNISSMDCLPTNQSPQLFRIHIPNPK
jgi:hypothetical protein